MPSLSFRSNVAVVLVLIPFLTMAALQVYVSKNVRESREQLIKKDIPIAIYSLSMLDELGDMNANMLGFVLGEEDEKAAYFDNLDEYDAFANRVPDDEDIAPSLKRVNRLVHDTTRIADEKIFSFDPGAQRLAKHRADEIAELYAWPLTELLKAILPDHQPGSSQQQVDVLLKLNSAQYQLKIIVAALNRHAFNDLEARYQFFDELLQLERGVEEYLFQLENTLRDSSAIEVMRLLSGIRRYGTQMLEEYDVRAFVLATSAIDEVEHYNYKVSEQLLTEATDHARENIDQSVASLKAIVSEANIINQLTALAGCLFLGLYLYHVRTSYLRPIAAIAEIINQMRLGSKDVEFRQKQNSREVFDIVSSLEAFDTQLNELEELRNSQRLQEQESHRADQERAYAELADRERKQRETADELRKANNDLEQFVHIASHDLREPLKKMSCFAQMLDMQLSDQLDDESRELLNIINSNAQSMASLIDDLRSLTRLNDSSLVVEDCNLDSIVHAVLSNHGEALKSQNASIQVGSLPTIAGYARLLHQMFDNLVRNALAHGDDNLLILSISAESSDNGYTVYCTNSSTQAAHASERLLQPFVKGKEAGGTGMGLAICKKIIDLHEGTISVDATTAHRFTVKLDFNIHFNQSGSPKELSSEHN